MSDRKRWNGTKLLDAGIWDRLLHPENKKQFLIAKRELRFGAGSSTVMRYIIDFTNYMNDTGAHKLLDFYMENGRDKRGEDAEY